MLTTKQATRLAVELVTRFETQFMPLDHVQRTWLQVEIAALLLDHHGQDQCHAA
jgi:hypothetical protein